MVQVSDVMQTDLDYANDVSFLLGVMQASGDCIKVLDLDGNLVYMTETGQQVMEILDFEAVRGCPWPDFWQDQGNIDAKAAIAAAAANGVGRFQGAATTMLGTPRYWDVQVLPLKGRDGRPERLLSVSRDITANHLSTVKLHQAQERLALALKAARIGYWDYDLRTGALETSDICRQNFGRDAGAAFTYQDLENAVHPADRQHRSAAVARTIATGEDLDVQYRLIRPDGAEAWALIQAKLVRSPQGEPIGLTGISLDITQDKRDEAHRQLLTQELSHRMKNQMAVVQGIVNQSLRGSKDIALAKQMIGERLAALSHAHDALIAGQGERASVLSIVQKAIEAFELGKASLTGPDMHIGPKAALSLALMLHELATNAVKYGALSDSRGHVDIAWDIGTLDGEPAFRVSWREHGGPLVAIPAHQGFGSRLLRAGMSGASSAVTLDYAPEGLHFEIHASLKGVQSES